MQKDARAHTYTHTPHIHSHTHTVPNYALWGAGAKRFCRAVNYLFQQGEWRQEKTLGQK